MVDPPCDQCGAMVWKTPIDPKLQWSSWEVECVRCGFRTFHTLGSLVPEDANAASLSREPFHVPVEPDALFEVVAEFWPPDAASRYAEWEDEHARVLRQLPDGTVVSDTGRVFPGGWCARV